MSNYKTIEFALIDRETNQKLEAKELPDGTLPTLKRKWGFAITDDGEILVIDTCGNYTYLDNKNKYAIRIQEMTKLEVI